MNCSNKTCKKAQPLSSSPSMRECNTRIHLLSVWQRPLRIILHWICVAFKGGRVISRSSSFAPFSGMTIAVVLRGPTSTMIHWACAKGRERQREREEGGEGVVKRGAAGCERLLALASQPPGSSERERKRKRYALSARSPSLPLER
jgi:hypothetical protein